LISNDTLYLAHLWTILWL